MAPVTFSYSNNLQPYSNGNKKEYIIFNMEATTFGAHVFLKPLQRPSKTAAYLPTDATVPPDANTLGAYTTATTAAIGGNQTFVDPSTMLGQVALPHDRWHDRPTAVAQLL